MYLQAMSKIQQEQMFVHLSSTDDFFGRRIDSKIARSIQHRVDFRSLRL